jgi:hypothetical protein
VAVVTSKRDHKRHSVSAGNAYLSHLLAAAVAVTALSLTACDSPVAESSKKAAHASNKAARIARSAGEIRPTKGFTEALDKRSLSELDEAGKQLVQRVKDDKSPGQAVYKQYFQQRSVAQDLKTATDLLNETLKMPEFNSPILKGAVQEQLGTTAIQQAHVQMTELEVKLNRMVSMAIDMQASAAYINGLGLEADVQEKRAQGATADLTKPTMNLDEAKAAAAKAQEAVSSLERKIEDLRKQAADIYAQTDAAMQAAEGMKGKEAIEHSRKAVEQRKQADNLTMEVSNLLPTLARAKAELVTAQLQQAQAEAQTAAATANAEQGAAVAKVATDRAAALRQQAKELIDGEKGLRAQYKEFTSLAADVQKDIEVAATSASAADNAFRSSIGQVDATVKRVQELNLEPGNTLEKVVGAREAKAILQLNQATAKEELGRANLMGGTLESLQGIVSQSMATAAKAARISVDAPTTAESTKKYAENAAAAFNEAAQLAESARTGVGAQSPIRWLALTLKSVALHGAATATNDPRKLEEAQAAARAAREENPFLPLQSLAGNPGNTPPANP